MNHDLFQFKRHTLLAQPPQTSWSDPHPIFYFLRQLPNAEQWFRLRQGVPLWSEIEWYNWGGGPE